MKPNLKDLETILNNAYEPTIQTLDKALHWLATFKRALKNLALDEPPFKGQYNGFEMLAIHSFINKEILSEIEEAT